MINPVQANWQFLFIEELFNLYFRNGLEAQPHQEAEANDSADAAEQVVLEENDEIEHEEERDEEELTKKVVDFPQREHSVSAVDSHPSSNTSLFKKNVEIDPVQVLVITTNLFSV